MDITMLELTKIPHNIWQGYKIDGISRNINQRIFEPRVTISDLDELDKIDYE